MPDTESSDLSALLSSLDAMSVDELTSLISHAEAARETKRRLAREQLVSEFRTRAEAIGVPFSDLLSAMRDKERPAGTSLAGRKLAAKYRGPNGEEWSGKGKTPRWLVAQEASGHTRDQFAVR